MVIYAIIVLGILIFVHEFGHFIVAKLFNVKVEKFSLGFGPKLFGKRIGETEYLLSAFPLGGYVKMFGEGGVIEGVAGPESANNASIPFFSLENRRGLSGRRPSSSRPTYSSSDPSPRCSARDCGSRRLRRCAT